MSNQCTRGINLICDSHNQNCSGPLSLHSIFFSCRNYDSCTSLFMLKYKKWFLGEEDLQFSPIYIQPPSFICQWDEGVDTSTAPCPASGSLCYKHILTSLRWRADTSFDNTQPTLMQGFSVGASQSCTKGSCSCFPILLGK